MVKIDTADLLKQLEELEKTITRKLEATVRDFAEEIARAAIYKTPRGSLEQFASYYEARTTWPQVPGLAQGNWQYTEGVPTFRLIAGPVSGEAALDGVMVNSQGYKLGENFYIANSTPYIGMLEQGSSAQAPAGIMNPTEMVVKAYSINLKQAFDAAK